MKSVIEVQHHAYLLIDHNCEIAEEFHGKRYGPGIVSFISIFAENRTEGVPSASFLEDTFDLLMEWCEEVAKCIPRGAASSSAGRR